MVSSWEPAQSLVEDAVSGAEIAAVPCLPALAVESLPLCLWAGEGPKKKQHPVVDMMGDEVKSDAVKSNIAQEPGMLGP